MTGECELVLIGRALLGLDEDAGLRACEAHLRLRRCHLLRCERRMSSCDLSGACDSHARRLNGCLLRICEIADLQEERSQRPPQRDTAVFARRPDAFERKRCLLEIGKRRGRIAGERLIEPRPQRCSIRFADANGCDLRGFAERIAAIRPGVGRNRAPEHHGEPDERDLLQIYANLRLGGVDATARLNRRGEGRFDDDDFRARRDDNPFWRDRQMRDAGARMNGCSNG